MNLLVKNNVDLRRFMNNLNSTFQYDFIVANLQQIQSGYISSIFGAAFITALADRHNAPTPSPAITTQERYLMDLLGNACANLAMANALPMLVVQLGNGGLFQQESTGTKSVYQWQKIDYENALLETGYAPIDAAIQYLWTNRDHAQFAAWKNSDAEKASLEYTVNTAADAQQSYPIGNSRRTYEALKPFIREAELFNLQPLISYTLYAALQAKRYAFTANDKEKQAIKLMRDVVMQDAIHRSIGRLTVKVDSDGYRVISIAGTGNDLYKNRNTGSADQLKMVKDETATATNRYANILCNYLLANITDFEDFKESDTYKQQLAPTSINSEDSKTFAF